VTARTVSGLVAIAILAILTGSLRAAPALADSQCAGTGGPQCANSLYGYPYSNAPDCDESPGSTSGCVLDNRGFYQGQCTSWVAYRLSQLNGINFTNSYGGNGTWGDASNWAAEARRLKITVDTNPAVGSVAWFSSGHVAYVEAVNSPTSVVISEMNYDFHNGFWVHTITTSAGWPTDFIHVADRNPGPWSAESWLGGYGTTIGAGRNADGRLEIFYQGTDGNLYHRWQNIAGGATGWSAESPFGGAAKSIAVATNLNGEMEVFYIGTDNRVYHRWQTSPNGGWSAESWLGGYGTAIAAGRDPDGHLEIFYEGTDGKIYHRWQNGPNGAGGWSAESSFGGAAKSLSLVSNPDGHLELFYIGTDNRVYHRWQKIPGGSTGWSAESWLGGSGTVIAAGQNTNGAVEIFYEGTDGNLYHRWQTTPGGSTGWSAETAFGGAAISLAAASNADGHLEVFYNGTDDRVYHRWRTS
jgi:surface antigen